MKNISKVLMIMYENTIDLSSICISKISHLCVKKSNEGLRKSTYSSVYWLVHKNIIQFSSNRFSAFRQLVEDNAHVIQPLHGRVVMDR